jgi:hypothetical protein
VARLNEAASIELPLSLLSSVPNTRSKYVCVHAGAKLSTIVAISGRELPNCNAEHVRQSAS